MSLLPVPLRGIGSLSDLEWGYERPCGAARSLFYSRYEAFKSVGRLGFPPAGSSGCLLFPIFIDSSLQEGAPLIPVLNTPNSRREPAPETRRVSCAHPRVRAYVRGPVSYVQGKPKGYRARPTACV